MTRRAGYSLFEVLIAFVILTLVLAALLPGQARLLDRATIQEQQLLAHDYALSQLAKIGTATPLTVGALESTYRNWRITTAIEPAASADSGAGFITIEIQVQDNRSRIIATVNSVMVGQ